MQVNELKIGNYVDFVNKGSLCYVSAIDDGGIILTTNLENNEYNAERDINDLMPIAITEDWLLKFGFKQHVPGLYKLINFIGDSYYYAEYNYGFGIIIEGERCTESIELACIKHIHSLQNLYFALTGIELASNLI